MMMVIVFFGFAELRCIEKFREILEVEHRIVFAVLAEERHIVTEPHVFEVICDEAAIATLDAFSEFGK